MAINYKAFEREYRLMEATGELGRLKGHLKESVKAGYLPHQDYSIREAWEDLVPGGQSELREWRRGNSDGWNLRESSATKRELLMNLNGIMVTSMVEMGYQQTNYIGDQLVTVERSTDLDGGRWGGVTVPGDVAEAIGEGQPYGSAVLGESWLWSPPMKKYGTKIGLTKEIILGDKTGQLFRNCQKIGESLAYQREIRILDMVLGLVPTPYKYKNNTAVDVYGDNSGDHNWDNLQASNGLVDWTDLEAASLLFDGLTDPATGWLINVDANQLLVPKALYLRALHLTGATEMRFVDNQANAATYQTTSRNLVSNYSIITSNYITSRQGNATTWYMGDFKRAFAYREAWPITVQQAPAGHPADFDADVVAQWKASEMGVAMVVEPRAVVKNTA